MREILFRGKSKIDNRFAYGFLWIDSFSGSTHIMTENLNVNFEVIPETVGQFTGVTDKNGVKIFEGDILLFGDKSFAVEWQNDIVGFGYFYTSDRVLGCDGINCEVIGNIHENLEKLI